MNKRVKYNWLYMIKDLNLTEAFEEFKSKHKDISLNRLARAFISHYKYILPYKCNCYLVGHEMPYLEFIHLQSIINVPWLD